MTEACGFDLGSTAARSSTSRSRVKAPIAQQGANCAVNVRQHAHFHLGGGVKTTQALLRRRLSRLRYGLAGSGGMFDKPQSN